MDHAWKKFERRVAEGFSRWLSGGKSAQVLARQSLLGRMVERIYGDLAPHPDCPEKYKAAAAWFMATFQVDAKRRKAFSIESVLHQPSHQLWAWWNKLLDDTASGKFPVLVLAAPRGGAIVLFADALSSAASAAYGSGDLPAIRLASPYARMGVLNAMSFDLWIRSLGDPQALGCPETPTGKGAVVERNVP